MTFDELAKRYLRTFQNDWRQAIDAGVQSTEMATRPTVHNFVASLIRLIRPEAIVHHDTIVRGSKNRPDWRIEDPATFGIYVYGDQKSLSPYVPFQLTAAEQGQIERYLELGRPVFVFDGLEFLFFDSAIQNPVRLQLVEKALAERNPWHDLTINPAVENKFRTLLDAPGFRQWTEEDLVDQLGKRARFLSDSIRLLLEAPLASARNQDERLLLESLKSLWGIVSTHHDPSLRDPNACSDFVAQVLAFGLFFAHTQAAIDEESPQERARSIRAFWEISNPPHAAHSLRPFLTMIECLSGSMNHETELSSWYVELTDILAHAEYMGIQGGGPRNFHNLFETFLKAFDRRARFDYGAFYTPKELADWMVRASDSLTREHFQGCLANIADTVIDPCCGTGTFLESIIEHIGLDQPRIPRLVGFEILPAPYALAHYRLNEVMENSAFRTSLRILLTDTMSDFLIAPQGGADNGFVAEQAEASSLAHPPIRLVIGNPPSVAEPAGDSPRTIIEGMLEEFRPPPTQRTDRQNIQKALRNEAYRFLRWSAQKVLETGAGIVALVLPGAFSYSVSFKYARKWLLENFDQIRIMQFDRDVRSGSASASLFNVMQGRLVLLAVKNGDNRPLSTIDFLDISDLERPDKLTFLESEPDFSAFASVTAQAPEWRFTPIGPYDEAVWNRCWPLRDGSESPGIFLQKCSGVKLAPTSLLFHTDRSVLIRRCREIAAQSSGSFQYGLDVLTARWWQGQLKPPMEAKLSPPVRRALGQAAASDRIIPYSYRPFVGGVVVADDEVFGALNATQGGGTRARPEIRAAFSEVNPSVAISPSTLDLGDTLTRFSSFVWDLPDNDLVARGNAMIYCTRFPRGRDYGRLHPNIRDSFLEFFDGDGDAVTFYVYGVLSSSHYLSAFESVLYGPETQPRIPVFNDAATRSELSRLGRELAECERPGSEYATDTHADWPEALAELSVARFRIDWTRSLVILEGQAGEIVSVGPIDPDVLTLRISGHDVIAKWLRERTFPYLRRAFRRDDMRSFLSLLGAIEAQNSIIRSIDAILERSLRLEKLLPPG